MKKVIILAFAVLLVLTGCKGGATPQPTTVSTISDPAKGVTVPTPLPSNSSSEAVMSDVAGAYIKGDYTALSKQIVPSYFSNAEQKTPSISDWITARTKDMDGKTVETVAVLDTGMLTPKFAPSIVGSPKKVMRIELKVKDKDGKQSTLDPVYMFPVEQDGKWYMSLQGDVFAQQLKTLNFDGKDLFAFITSTSNPQSK